MAILYKQECDRIDTYTFQINQGGSFQIKIDGAPDQEIKLVFVNGKFSSSELPFLQPYSRSHWHILGAIAQKIADIEATYGVKPIEKVVS